MQSKSIYEYTWKIYMSFPYKKVINKFMIIRYKLQSIYYVYFVENKQRKNIQFNISNFY
jgi:hypothetical protein